MTVGWASLGNVLFEEDVTLVTFERSIEVTIDEETEFEVTIGC